MDEFMIFLIQYAVFPIALICFGIGYVIKHYIPVIPNNYIPLILAACGLVLNVAFNSWQFSPEIVLVGIGSGLVATGSFEAIRNLNNKK